MAIDWKEFAFIVLPSALAGGGTAWYAKKKGIPLIFSSLAGGGVGFITFYAMHFIRRRFNGAPEQLPEATMPVTAAAQVPVVTPTADAALGAVAAREKAVAPNVKPTNSKEVGDNVVDIGSGTSADDGGMNLDAFGSIGSE